MFPQIRLETVGAGSTASRQHEEDDSSVASTATGGTAVPGFITADSIRQRLLPSLPTSFDVNAIEAQVCVNYRATNLYAHALL